MVRKQIQNRKSSRKLAGVGRPKQSEERGKIVLVIDDDASALGALSRLIRCAGFTVRAFDNPSALLESRLPIEKTCLIIDIYLPEMNGVELSNSLAAAGHRLPTILITGRNDEGTRRLVEKCDAVAVLYKPVDEVPLLEAISRCFSP